MSGYIPLLLLGTFDQNLLQTDTVFDRSLIPVYQGVMFIDYVGSYHRLYSQVGVKYCFSVFIIITCWRIWALGVIKQARFNGSRSFLQWKGLWAVLFVIIYTCVVAFL